LHHKSEGSGAGGAAEPDGQKTDEELMGRYVDGDRAAFMTLFGRYTGRIYGYLLHCTGDRALAEDLAQQTWLRLHHARATFQPGARFAPWIYTIAANLRRDHVRGSTREYLTADGEAPEPEPELPAAGATERAEAVQRALGSLPAGYREVIVLHRWHELGFAEIAQILGTTEGAIKVRAHRGYLKLRELLQRAGLR